MIHFILAPLGMLGIIETTSYLHLWDPLNFGMPHVEVAFPTDLLKLDNMS